MTKPTVTFTRSEAIDVESAIEFYEDAVRKVHATLWVHGDQGDGHKAILDRLIEARFKVRYEVSDASLAQAWDLIDRMVPHLVYRDDNDDAIALLAEIEEKRKPHDVQS